MRTFPQIAEESEEENHEDPVKTKNDEASNFRSLPTPRYNKSLSLDLKKCKKRKDLPLAKPAVVITKSLDDTSSEFAAMKKASSPIDGKSSPRSASPIDQSENPHKEVRGRTDSLPVEKLSPHSHFWEHGARMRRKSGDDALSACSSSHKNAIFEAFRPRSKSDSKSKKPNIVSVLKNSMKSSGSPSSPKKNLYRKTPPPSPLTQSPVISDSGSIESESPKNTDVSDSLKRPKGESETQNFLRGSPVSKVFDKFRTRSSSLAGDAGVRKKLYGEKSSSNSSIHVPSSLLRRHSVDPDKKRSTPPAHQRASVDGTIDHNAAFLFRNSEGVVCADTFYDRIKAQTDSDEEDLVFVKFFQHHTCYDIVPISAKLVVFDTELVVKHAFHALVQNGVRAAPLWCSKTHEVTGMITVTDFIHMLQKYYKSPMVHMDELEEHKLELWKNAAHHTRGLISISPYDSLFDAIKTLIKHRVHRLPIIDPENGNVLHILTHKRILKFLFRYMNDIPQPTFLKKSIRELNIGTYDNIATAKPETPLIEALNIFIEKRVSALPVVDDDGRVVDIYAKFDIINLAAERTYDNLEVTIKKALEHRNEWFEGVLNCKIEESLASVMERICQAEVHRLVVVDDEGRVKGIISLSDILKSLVSKHSEIKEIEEMKKSRNAGSKENSPGQQSTGSKESSPGQQSSGSSTPKQSNSAVSDISETMSMNNDDGCSKGHTCGGATVKGKACLAEGCRSAVAKTGSQEDDCDKENDIEKSN